MFTPWHLITIILSSLLMIEAKPKCTTYNDKDVVCTAAAGDTDYQLVRGLVSDNERTTGITLRACRIYDIQYESFMKLDSLAYLDLSMNKLETLKLGVLDEPKQLTYLNLSYNAISYLPVGLFDRITKLDLLDLKGNKLNKLTPGIFNPLPNLKFVDLSSNPLLGKELSPNLFERSHHITFMDFSRNDMTGAPENLLNAFESLEILNLDRCFLKEVPEFATKFNLKTMKHLIISINQISNLSNHTTFVNLINIEILDFSYNVIETIDGDIFSQLKKLQKVDLRNNRIKTIPENLFRNMPKLISVDIYGNEIEYVPVNAFRGSPLKNLNLSDNKITYLQDNFCLELRNSGGKLKKLLFHSNPWQCACLNELLKEVKSLGIDYNTAKYNGKNPVCVSTADFNCKRQQDVNSLYIDMYSDVIDDFRASKRK